MDNLIINIFGVDSQLSRGFIFGLVHVSIMLLGSVSYTHLTLPTKA